MLLTELNARLVSLLKNTRVASARERCVALQAGANLVYRAISDIAGGDYFFQESALVIPANTTRIALIDPAVFPKTPKRIRRIISRGQGAADLNLGPGFGEGGFGEGGFGGGVAAEGSASFNGRFRFVRRDCVHPEFLSAEVRDAVSDGLVFFDLAFRVGFDQANAPILMLAPAILSEETVLVASIYEPTRFTDVAFDPSSTVEVEPIIERFEDIVLFRAMEVLLRAVNDSDAATWGADALQARSAMIQTLGKLVESENGHVVSGLDWGDV